MSVTKRLIEQPAVISFGANLGDRRATLLAAARELADADGVELTAISPVIETILTVERVQAFADAAFGGRDEPETTDDDTADTADTDAGEQALGLDWGQEASA